ncbi:sigma-70 family RNA polymerase sigma factor [Novosphingobium sp. FSW06-99]|uniref:sigma-70 family RNA polymerase sigma factor n=1 Tax=Novosphingobium sp. FSW06-99 TaxID=1739113 RepID=UPI001E3F4A74|nr:sigma-70 family RNA polymerase sigma factor [Novosphingobium sp. FSW06-99]
MPILEPLIPGLRRYARALVRNAALADDLVQDCLERAIARWHQRRSGCSTRAWLYAILNHTAIDEARRATRRGRHLSIDDAMPADLSSPATQEQSMFAHDILAAVDLLPQDQRSVLLLVGVEELSYAEAAEVIGVPIGTIMSRLSRARDRLRGLLDNQAARPALRSVQ